MRRLAAAFCGLLAVAVCFAIPAEAWFKRGVAPTFAPEIQAVALSFNSFAAPCSSGTAIGAVSVTMSTGSFTGSLSVSGTDAAKFQMSGSQLQCAASNAAGSYSINLVATQGGATGSPYAQPETILGTSAPSGVQVPGPSAALYASPYYSCTRNFYVNGSTGSNSNDGTSPTHTSGTVGPWLTIAKADSASRAGGDCINVASGTYAAFNSALAHGGSTASSTGYVAYRCSTLDACVITSTAKVICSGQNCGAAYPNYLIFDGFNFDTQGSTTVANSVAITCTGPGSYGNTQTTSLGCHHWMVLNSLLTGHGLAGVSLNDTEYTVISHNTVTQNAHQGCNGFYGSGIAMVVAKPVSGYTPTADDTNSTDNAALDLIGIQGTTFPFHNTIAWNVTGNNYQGCSPFGQGQTDGNNIIIDTFLISGCNTNQVNYTGGTLVAFNVSYNAGGGGIHVFASSDVVVANNSMFNNMLDPTLGAFTRYNMDVQCGQSTAATGNVGANTNYFFNNIAYALPNGQACPGSPAAYLGSQGPAVVAGSGTTGGDGFSNSPGRNISYQVGTPCHQDTKHLQNGVTKTGPSGNATYNGNPLWDCGANKCSIDPKWVDVGSTAIGDETTAPNGVNFALQATSPAVGYGVTQTYLPAQSVDVGACASSLATCP